MRWNDMHTHTQLQEGANGRGLFTTTGCEDGALLIRVPTERCLFIAADDPEMQEDSGGLGYVRASQWWPGHVFGSCVTVVARARIRVSASFAITNTFLLPMAACTLRTSLQQR